MFKSKIKRLGGRLALITTATALTMAAAASAASATVVVNPSEGIEWTGDTVSVLGTTGIPTGTTHVAIVVCNAEAIPGTRCDASSGTPGFKTVGEYGTGISIPLRRGPWVDFDFTAGTPPAEKATTTTCLSESEGGEQCAVVVSFYQMTKEGPKQLGADGAPVFFE